MTKGLRSLSLPVSLCSVRRTKTGASQVNNLNRAWGSELPCWRIGWISFCVRTVSEDLLPGNTYFETEQEFDVGGNGPLGEKRRWIGSSSLGLKKSQWWFKKKKYIKGLCHVVSSVWRTAPSLKSLPSTDLSANISQFCHFEKENWEVPECQHPCQHGTNHLWPKDGNVIHEGKQMWLQGAGMRVWAWDPISADI